MKVVIIGSGFAGMTLATELKKQNPQSTPVVITMDKGGTYSRPLLSHAFASERSVLLKSFDALRADGILILENTRVVSIDRKAKIVNLDNSEVTYDTLVLAQGSEAFIPPPYAKDHEHFQVFNDLEDMVKLKETLFASQSADRKAKVAIIGGGLIGCELASDLNKAGHDVSIFHIADRLMERQLKPEQSSLLETHFRHLGIGIFYGQTSLEIVKMTGFDAIIVAAGFRPRVDLAKSAGLAVNRGIVTNGQFQTSDDSIYAIGDVAEIGDKGTFAFVSPIRSQAIHLAGLLNKKRHDPWTVPSFPSKAKIHGLNLEF